MLTVQRQFEVRTCIFGLNFPKDSQLQCDTNGSYSQDNKKRQQHFVQRKQ